MCLRWKLIYQYFGETNQQFSRICQKRFIVLIGPCPACGTWSPCRRCRKSCRLCRISWFAAPLVETKSKEKCFNVLEMIFHNENLIKTISCFNWFYLFQLTWLQLISFTLFLNGPCPAIFFFIFVLSLYSWQ